MAQAPGIAASLCGALLLAACSAGPGGFGRKGPELRPAAQPGQVVAAELALARTAREKGQWTAFAEYAARDAVIFGPEPANAQQWLKGRSNPAVSAARKPYQLWSSCDGSLAVTKGGWDSGDGSYGHYTTVWQRQENGGYKWVLNLASPLETSIDEPEMVQAQVADCATVPNTVAADAPLHPAAYHWAVSAKDRTLQAEVILDRDGTGRLAFSFVQAGAQPIPEVPINTKAK